MRMNPVKTTAYVSAVPANTYKVQMRLGRDTWSMTPEEAIDLARQLVAAVDELAAKA